MKLYENVFMGGEWGSDLWVRLFDTETKTSDYKKIPINKFVPPVYALEPEKAMLKAEYTAFDTGLPLYKNTFKNTIEQKQFLKTINQQNAYGLMDRKFHYIREEFPNPEDCNHSMRTCFLDIEVEVTENGFPKPENAREMVTIIQMYDTFLQEFFILGTRKWTGTYDSKWGSVRYIQFENEIKLLEAFIQIIQKTNPAIISGFNSNPFDMPYLVNRMKNLGIDFERLSPIGEIEWKDSVTQDGFAYRGVEIKGILLVDYKDLAVKYGFLKVPSFSLENVAHAYGLEGKSKQKSYTYQSFNGNYSGEGYTQLISDELEVPEDELKVWTLQKKYPNGYKKGNDEELEQAVFDTFMKYAIRDVEVMLEIDEKSKLLNLAKTIAYLSGVTMDDVKGTLKFWLASMYNTAYKDKVILPMKQRYSEDCNFLAGWVRAKPGRHRWVTSFDIGSAHPHQHVNHNIGADSLIKTPDLHPDLQELKKKYFSFYDIENWQKVIAGKKEPNDTDEETDYIIFLLNNVQNIQPVLEKHNVIATINGSFYRKDKQCYAGKIMREGLDLRMTYKKRGKNIRAEIEKLKTEGAPEEVIKSKISDAEYAEAMSLAFKIRINAYYGANSLSSNPYSNGDLTGAAVAMSTRAVNKIQAIAVDRTIKKFLKQEQDDTLSTIKVCDTDSIYATLEDLVDTLKPEDPVEFCKKFSNEVLLPEIYRLEKIFLEGFNVLDAGMMKFDNEIIAEGLVSVVPKRYFAAVRVVDGTTLSKPKMKAVGISLISNSTPQGVKEIIAPTLDMFIHKDEKYIRNYLKVELEKFKKLKASDIAGAVGVSSLAYTPFCDKKPTDDWKKADKFKSYNQETKKFLTAPLNSKGSIIHNHLLKEYNLMGRYEEIEESNKVNVVYLLTPNPITYSHNAIAFKDGEIIKDLGLEEYIDIEKQWNKEVQDKIQLIATAIGWNTNDVPDALDEW